MSDIKDLEGKVALVTGGAVGIGQAIAFSLARAGADVGVTWASHAEEGKATVEAIERLGGRAFGSALDARSSSEVDDVFGAAIEAMGRLDICVNNAGGMVQRVSVAQMSDVHWNAVLALNLTSAFYCTRAALARLSEGGRIVNVASVAAFNGGGPGASAYAAAKAGMCGFTRALVREVAPRGITVNAVAPGLILDTPFHRTFTPPAAQEEAIDGIPLGRPGYPDDVAAAVVWLCSSGAGWITGETLIVSGGSFLRA